MCCSCFKLPLWPAWAVCVMWVIRLAGKDEKHVGWCFNILSLAVHNPRCEFWLSALFCCHNMAFDRFQKMANPQLPFSYKTRMI